MAFEIKENEILTNHSTFKIGGPARYFVVAKSKEEILEAIEFAKQKNLPFFILGGGSNILFSDKGFDGIIIKIQNTKYKIQDENIIASAGMSFAKLISQSVENGLSGLEWGVGIPGTIGGCAAGNCGAYGHDISESVRKITTLDKEYSKDECQFSYRKSKFKNSENKEIILEIELKLEKGDKEKNQEKIKNILSNRRGKIPPYPSIGCIFKNPKPLSAKNLIEQCGLSGKQIGGARISELHANFIVNVGRATSEDVLTLINLCKEKVREKFSIGLEEEIVVV